jgi:hypothetical protein
MEKYEMERLIVIFLPIMKMSQLLFPVLWQYLEMKAQRKSVQESRECRKP